MTSITVVGKTGATRVLVARNVVRCASTGPDSVTKVTHLKGGGGDNTRVTQIHGTASTNAPGAHTLERELKYRHARKVPHLAPPIPSNVHSTSGEYPKQILRPPRAVTAEEAPFIQPAMESTKSGMSPWRGWFQRFVRDQLGEEKFRKFRYLFFYEPDAIYDLQQAPKPAEKIPISKTDPTITHMYRYPSPGSQEPARVPLFPIEGNNDPGNPDPFDSGYFKRDTKRRYEYSEMRDPDVEKAQLMLMDPNDPEVKAAKERLAKGPESSPGNKGMFATGPSNFDTTGGLRATMSVNWPAVNKVLDANMPDHLPTPVWAKREEEISQWRKDRNLPPPVGEYYAPLKLEPEYRVAQW